MKFTDDHEWVSISGDVATVGITDFAAGELGDIVYVELPDVGAAITAGESMGTIEAVKTVADLFAPVSGTILEINTTLEDEPEQVNGSPYEAGWFVKVTMADTSQLDSLMDHAAYQELTGK